MKILWVEDHEHAIKLIEEIKIAAARKRLPLDIVSAPNLTSAEQQLRRERFDLVLLDLQLPDSLSDMTSACRIANLGQFKLAVVSASPHAQEIVDVLERSLCDNVSKPIPKDDLPFVEFIQNPQKFMDFAEGLCA